MQFFRQICIPKISELKKSKSALGHPLLGDELLTEGLLEFKLTKTLRINTMYFQTETRFPLLLPWLASPMAVCFSH